MQKNPIEQAVSTRERILEMALSLFNEEGVERVAIHKISARLDISPGNLTYYFAKRRDIVATLVDRLEERLIGSWQRTDTATDPNQMALSLLEIFDVLWEYRFFFRSVSFLADDDDGLADRYDRLERNICNAKAEIVVDAIEKGFMRKIVPPTTPMLLVENMWRTWIMGIAFYRFRFRNGDADRREVLFNSFIHHVSLIQPYSSQVFLKELVKQAKLHIRRQARASDPVPPKAA